MDVRWHDGDMSVFVALGRIFLAGDDHCFNSWTQLVNRVLSKSLNNLSIENSSATNFFFFFLPEFFLFLNKKKA